MGLFYFHAGTCKSTDCSNNYTTRHTAHIKKTGLRAEALQNLSFIRKLTSHAILTFIPFGLAVFSGRNLHARAHGGSQGDAL